MILVNLPCAEASSLSSWQTIMFRTFEAAVDGTILTTPAFNILGSSKLSLALPKFSKTM